MTSDLKSVNQEKTIKILKEIKRKQFKA